MTPRTRSPLLDSPAAETMAGLFDHVPDICFFAKDAAGRFVHANRALLDRLGLQRVEDIAGTTDRDRYPAHVAEQLVAGDRKVLESGHPIVDHAEVLFDRSGRLEWFSTSKYPVYDPSGIPLGVMGVTRPLSGARFSEDNDRLGKLIDFICSNPDRELRVADLARRAGLSERQLHRRFLGRTGMAPREFILRTRIQAAAAVLRRGEESIASVALQFQFCDQSSFTRQFRRVLGTTPAAYRRGG